MTDNALSLDRLRAKKKGPPYWPILGWEMVCSLICHFLHHSTYPCRRTFGRGGEHRMPKANAAVAPHLLARKYLKGTQPWVNIPAWCWERSVANLADFPSRFVDHPFLVEKLMAPFDVAEKDLRAVVSSIFDPGLSDGVGDGAWMHVWAECRLNANLHEGCPSEKGAPF